jgi:hypothetical protein
VDVLLEKAPRRIQKMQAVSFELLGVYVEGYGFCIYIHECFCHNWVVGRLVSVVKLSNRAQISCLSGLRRPLSVYRGVTVEVITPTI